MRVEVSKNVNNMPPVVLYSSSSSSLSLPSPITFGVLNIRSLTYKLDDLLEVRRDRSIDVLGSVETWHDAESIALRRLRVNGFSVVDRLRPRYELASRSDMCTNHGGVALVAAPGVHLTPVVIDCPMSTVEVVAARVNAGRYAAVVVVLYRPGADAVRSTFFEEFTMVFEAVATYRLPVFVVGDFSVHLERLDNPDTRQLIDLV